MQHSPCFRRNFQNIQCLKLPSCTKSSSPAFQNGITSFATKNIYISCNSVPCFVPRLKVTPMFSGCSHTMLQHRPQTTPLTFTKLNTESCVPNRKESRQVLSKETCPCRYISITVHNTSALPQLSKMEIPYIQHIELGYLQSTSAVYRALCNQVFYSISYNYVCG